LGNDLVVIEGAELPENPPEYLSESNDESSLLSFVIHLWKEDSDSEEPHLTWRGHITPVPNGQRHYFSHINQIPDLIVSHLKLQR
jgi:hypothetical protein